jgi:hypothetical protein
MDEGRSELSLTDIHVRISATHVEGSSIDVSNPITATIASVQYIALIEGRNMIGTIAQLSAFAISSPLGDCPILACRAVLITLEIQIVVNPNRMIIAYINNCPKIETL